MRIGLAERVIVVGIIVGIFCCIGIIAADGLARASEREKLCASAPLSHSYKMQWPDIALETPGTSIRSNGFCVEVLIGDKVDTVACGVKYVTELPPSAKDEATPPAPTATRTN